MLLTWRSCLHRPCKHLGTLTYARAVVQALASPLAGFVGQYTNRVHVIAAGAALWGACCLGFATVHSVGAGLPFWALNGVGCAGGCGSWVMRQGRWVRSAHGPTGLQLQVTLMLLPQRPSSACPPLRRLALLIPAAQSMTADGHTAQRRGRAFGLLYFTGAVGALIGALGATNLGHTRPLGIQGWRCAGRALAGTACML